jgi:hypothetical protein
MGHSIQSYAFRCASRTRCEAVLHDSHYAIWTVTKQSTVEALGHISDQSTNYILYPKKGASHAPAPPRIIIRHGR